MLADVPGCSVATGELTATGRAAQVAAWKKEPYARMRLYLQAGKRTKHRKEDWPSLEQDTARCTKIADGHKMPHISR